MKKIYDIETFIDSTVVVFKSIGKNEYDVFYNCNLEFKPLPIPKCNFYSLLDIKSYVSKNNMLIGFNNQYFDNPILEDIIRGICNPHEVYKLSQLIINSKERFFIKYKDNQLSFKYLDLFKINHYDNPARSTSLKKLEFNYRRKRVNDLPFDHTTCITTYKQLEELIRYCIDDTQVTEECYNNSLDQIKMRESLIQVDPRLNCMNLSEVSIGEEKNLLEYCDITGQRVSDVKYNRKSYPDLLIKFNDCIPDYITFRSKHLQTFLDEIKLVETAKTKGYHKEVIVDGVEITYGQGGIHSINYPGIIKSNDTHIIISVDVGSQYPSNIIKRKLKPRHLSDVWTSNIEKTYIKRITEYKPLAKSDPVMAALSDGAKLQMNGGGYGKTNSEYSWQYDPEVTMKITLTCQLELLMLIEKLTMHGFRLLMANTDGAEFYVNREELETFYGLCNDWEIETNNNKYGRLEYQEYNLIAQTSVNDYIAQTVKGELKRKGSFMTYEDIKSGMWHKDASGMIIPYALQKYFIDGISIEETINSCNDIFEFCYGAKRQKAAKKGNFKWLISSVNEKGMSVNRLNSDRFIRYYIGGTETINKLYEDGDIKNLPTKENPVTVAQYLRREEILKGDVNAYPALDRSFYINEAMEIINSIENG